MNRVSWQVLYWSKLLPIFWPVFFNLCRRLKKGQENKCNHICRLCQTLSKLLIQKFDYVTRDLLRLECELLFYKKVFNAKRKHKNNNMKGYPQSVFKKNLNQSPQKYLLTYLCMSSKQLLFCLRNLYEGGSPPESTLNLVNHHPKLFSFI